MRRARQLRWVQIALMLASLPLAYLSVTAWAGCMFVLVLVGLVRERELERQIVELASRSREEAVMAMSGRSLSDLEVERAELQVRAFELRVQAEERKQRGER